jgi:hypothetical protein
MKKTIFLHIGAHKTGTTAIQRFLSENRHALQEDGYIYPGSGEAHHDMAREFRTLTPEEIRSKPDLAIHRYFKEIDSSEKNFVIISCEMFEFLRMKIGSLKNFLVPKYNVKIVYYVRRQDDLIESLYSWSMKNSQQPATRTFQEFYSGFPGRDYNAILKEWKDAFGRENIIVRCYESEQLPRGIFNDFMNTVGIRIDSRYKIPAERINERLPMDLLEIIRICNKQSGADTGLHMFLIRSLKKIRMDAVTTKQHLLSPVQRRQIISEYEKTNAQVAREYLGRDDGRLFYASLPDINEPWAPYEGLTVEKITPVLTQMLFNMDREMRYQKQWGSKYSLKRKLITIIKKTGARFGILPAMKYWYARFYNS